LVLQKSETLDPGTRTGPLERRTFAIISHPDAGKTTLTEKLLLFGGAIHLAGHVKARGERRRTQSDWMAIERARGISVSSSVMTFEHAGIQFNLLDTPGHQDFSEDTYRTLTAVDSAVMVIDAAKGIESQTRKLFEVCRLRDVPILTFINKVDREGRDAFELLDEIADMLALDVAPVTWPVGMGGQFRGCYHLHQNRLLLPGERNAGAFATSIPCSGLDDPQLAKHVPEGQLEEFQGNAELALSAYASLDVASYRGGHLTPVVFGSALKDFCVTELLECLTAWAPPPRVQPATPEPVKPDAREVTGFVFKVQANMDPNHRDRVAFMRVCSGRFRRGMKLKQVRGDKTITVTSPIFFFAQDREIADEAFPGDIIGIPNHGVLRVGDTLTEGASLRFTGLPSFAPELLRRVRLEDPLRAKQMRKALEDLAEEGVAQLFRPRSGVDWIVGVVGALQLDVLASRLDAEYKVAVSFETAPFETARWVASDDPAQLAAFLEAQRFACADDSDGAPVYLARNAWELRYTMDNWKAIRFSATRER
jgi:peptide chain release factor 3